MAATDFSGFVYDVRSSIEREHARRRLARRRRARRRELLVGAVVIGALIALGRLAGTLALSPSRTAPRTRPRLDDSVRFIPVPVLPLPRPEQPPAKPRNVPRAPTVIALRS